MTRTDILGLAKREPNEKYNLEQNNANMDIIDTFADVIVQATPTVPATAEGNAIVLNNSSDKELIGLTLNGNTTQAGTPTPEAPVELVSVVNPVVTINGKNLLDKDNVTNALYLADGTLQTNINFTLFGFVPISSGMNVTLSAKYIGSDAEYLGYAIFDKNKNFISRNNGNPKNESVVINIEQDGFIRCFVSQTQYDTSTAQLEIGSTATEYEPYKAQTLSIPYTLNGVGDVRDYVDFERGVLVRKCKEIIVDGTNVKLSLMSSFEDNGETVLQVMFPDKDGISPYGLCSHLERNTNLWSAYPYPHFLISNENGNDKRYFRAYFKGYADIDSLNASFATNPMTIIYPSTPTETPLTAEELEAFKQLTTYKPVTTITNSENAEMSVGYKADTKTVLKEKLDKIIMR